MVLSLKATILIISRKVQEDISGRMGIITSANGLRANKNGKGEMHYYNGDVFKGRFLDDKMHGVGYWQYANRDSDGESDEDSSDTRKVKLVRKRYENGEEVKDFKRSKKNR